MKILITGNMGYVGPAVTAHLRKVFPDAYLAGYDTGYFAHCLTASSGVFPEIRLDCQMYGDVRDISADVVRGFDAIVHLAAISNDPMGSRFEAVTEEINFRASAALAHLAVEHGVSRFVFASSCSMYGFAEGGARQESAPLNPLTAYARSKVATEKTLQSLSLDATTVTSLRFATACGMSDRLRLDLVLNDLVACAISSKRITVLSDGSPWRPLIDVKDMARAIEWALTRDPDQGGRYLAVNAGTNEANFQVIELANAVAKLIPGTSVTVNENAPPDKRSYQVDFSLYQRLAPRHQPQISIEESARGIAAGLKQIRFNDENFRSSSFIRLKALEEHIGGNRLNSALRWI